MKCRICGVEYKDTDRFCGICGTPNPIFEAKPAVSHETTPTSDKSDEINELYDTVETVSAAETADKIKTTIMTSLLKPIKQKRTLFLGNKPQRLRKRKTRLIFPIPPP